MELTRDLTQEEINLIKHLLSHIPEFEKGVPEKAWTMNDGGMESISFDLDGKSEFGKCLINMEYIDSDGVVVLIGLIADKSGNLFELDIWKTDFAPLVEYPTPEKLKTVANNVYN